MWNIRGELFSVIKQYIGLLLALLATVLLLVGCSDGSDNDNISQAVLTQVKINEVMPVNSYYAPLPDGSCCDWVELYNSSQKPVNLKGCMLSDNERLANKWKIPTDFILEAGGYGIIYLSGRNTVDEQGNLHTNFKLSSKGETLLFSNAAGELVQRLEIPACSLANVSYGRNDAGKYVWFALPSPGKVNGGSTADDPDALEFPESGLRINEYMSKNTYVIYDSNGQYSDWVELYNSSDADVNLYGYALSDSQSGGKWFFPEDAVIPAGGYLVVFCTDTLSSDPAVYHANFKLSGGDVLTLYSVAGTVVDSVEVADLNPNVSCGRDPTSGEFRLFAVPTPGRTNSTGSYELMSAVQSAPYSQLYISEALCVSDSSGKYNRDFIEIHNASSEDISLKGCGLSKSSEAADGEKFTFPDMKIAAGGYEVVYCTGKNSVKKDNLTAAFKLNQGGEDICLFDSGGHIMDMLATGKQTYGHSSGRANDAAGGVVHFEKPTPGAGSGGVTTYAGYAPMPSLSAEGGYVKKGFQVSISVPQGTTVRYTVSGTDPTEHSAVYKTPLTIDETTVVKAVAFRDGYLPSQTVFATFLVEQEHSIPVVSVASDPSGLFSNSEGILSSHVGGLVAGKENYYSDEERPITFEYYENGTKTAAFNAMTRVFGETSRKQPQKALAVILSEKCGANEVYYPFFGEYSVDVFSSFVLRPSGQDWMKAHMRDELCARLARDMELDCMEAQPVALYLNGSYWGLYYLREKLNEDYLVHKYGMTKGQIDIVKWERAQQAGSRDGYLELCDYCETHDLTVQKYYDYVCSQIDIDSLMDWWIFETYVANNDTGNVRCYRDQNGGKWKWMLFDLDYAFTLSTYKKNYVSMYMRGPFHGQAQCNNSIPRNLLKNEDFREKFILRYFHHVKTTFDPDRVNAFMDDLATEMEDEMPRQAERWGSPTVSYWNYNMKTIKNIVAKKPELAKQQIKEAFRLSDKQVEAYYNEA